MLQGLTLLLRFTHLSVAILTYPLGDRAAVVNRRLANRSLRCGNRLDHRPVDARRPILPRVAGLPAKRWTSALC